MFTHTTEIALNYFIIAETKQDVKVISFMSVVIPAVLLFIVKW